MTRLQLLVAFLVCLALTIVSGVVPGRISGRWGVPEGTAAAEKLEALPGDFADWKLEESSDLPGDARNMLECFGYINRVYTHRSTGQALSVFVLVGPCKPTAEHTPEVCYSGRNYTVIQQPEETSILVEGHGSDEFWNMTFRSKNLEGDWHRVYYAWSDGQHWRADKAPQYAYPGRRYLYKIQASAPLSHNASVDKGDVVRSFLNDFLPVLQNYMVPQPD